MNTFPHPTITTVVTIFIMIIKLLSSLKTLFSNYDLQVMILNQRRPLNHRAPKWHFGANTPVQKVLGDPKYSSGARQQQNHQHCIFIVYSKF